MIRKLANLKLCLLGGIFLVAAPLPAKADAKLFTELKCNKCHTINAASIALLKSDADKEEGEEAGGPKAPDLSTVGKYHDAAVIESFLKKEAGHVPHEGEKSDKKHKIKFKGTDEQLKAMAAWLATLK